ncbi:MAG: hypothetical protein CM15mP81_04950 [Alphaproteobacteria bacterium]|nr:MAG: hypothetical protein CM15mP81_04950 [Alphaproteobacteria bacterium]
MILSNLPPKEPAIIPSNEPITAANNAAKNPTIKLNWFPKVALIKYLFLNDLYLTNEFH